MSAKNIEDAYPLSPMQEGMLFHSLLAPQSGIFITQVSCRLRDLDASVFAQMWQQLIDRQAILRSAFVWKNVEKPLQVVGRHVGLVLEQQDWRGLSSSAQEERFEAYLEADRKAGFNLMKAPVMRMALFRTSERDHKFLWSHHHILMDGWSSSLLLSDFFSLYKAASGSENHSGATRRPYRDYIGWLQQQNLGQAEAFWRRTLKGFDEPTRLGIERKSINAELLPPQSHNYEEQQLNLSESTTAGLQELGRTHQVTLNTVVQGAWALLLSRYSGNEDVVFGATVSGRPASLPGVEEMIGLFINTLPVRVEVKSEEGIGEYLRRLQEQQAEVRQYEYSPLVEVQGWSEVGRGVSLFDTNFVFENYPVTGILKENNWGLEVSDVRSLEPSNYPLTLIALPGTTLRLNLIYDRERYDTASITRMLGHLETLFEAIALNPEQPLAALSLLTPAERDQILIAWNQIRRAYAQDRCLHELLEAQVARTPYAPAITFEDRHLTYRQLNERASQLARHLQHLGVGPEVLVGVLMERSLEMVIALYAILKAGGAYVPLEPSYPRERLTFMLNDLSVSVVLTQQRFADILPQHGAHFVSLDTDWSAFAGERVHDLAVTLTPLNVAYVIYTSGSTGQPKGVVIEHSSIVNYICWAQSVYLHEGEPADCAFYSSLAFDLTVTSVFLPLVTGNTLHLYPQHEAAPSLPEVMAHNRCHLLKLTPSHLSLIRDLDNRSSQIRCLIVGGEALSTELAYAVSQSFGHQVEIYNEYGPTEATVGCMIYRFEPESDERAWVPIGRPAANTQIYILDKRLEPTAEHVTGELYIGGAGVARGYLGRGGLTAERFVPDPFSGCAGGRLYRTGDRARRLANGNIEYLGRIDQQVKIRGFRIEPEEIRVALMQHPDVKEALITTHGDEIENRRLVAYIIAAAERELSSSDFRDYLKERLPEYMVPPVFVMLQKVPLTSNGKIDYRALPQPNGLNVGLKNEYVAPRTDVEQLLRDIWHEVIGVERIGIHDNFFDLGGHSILLLKAQQKIRARFQHELSLVELFKYPTIHLLAEHMKREPDAAAEPPSFQQSFDRALTRRELVSRLREVRKGMSRPHRIDPPATAGGTDLAPSITSDFDARSIIMNNGNITERPHESNIAIVSMAGRFPGAKNIEEFWRNLRAGVESISTFSDEELLAAGVSLAELCDPSYVRAKGMLDDIELFDGPFFGFNPREVEITDPQHRIFLECAWEALERAGYDTQRYEGRIGVYGGVGISGYLLTNLATNLDIINSVGVYQTLLSNDKDFLTTRVSYKLNLKGPSLVVQTACSTSLVAVHLACQSLLSGESDMALAGGITISVPQKSGYQYQKGSINSPDGHCRAFDAQANGTVPGNGVSIVLLKRLDDALADGDIIHAVIKGSAINNDGSLKIGYTAPSIDGQSEVIVEAQAIAGVSADSISYIEAHGTATALGDPIEVAALTQAFRASTSRSHFCALGSVKSNFGHLDTAAGVAGLIKTVLALKHKELPPSLHYTAPNPEIDFASSPFYVNQELRAWETNGNGPRRAGVSSFGIGGTNAHVVVEEAPRLPATAPSSRGWHLLALSGRTAEAVKAATEKLRRHLEAHLDVSLADVAYTLQVGRREFAQRRAVVCRDVADAIEALSQPARWIDGSVGLAGSNAIGDCSSGRGAVLMYSGQGAQYAGMGRELYEREAIFRQTLDQCAAAFEAAQGYDLREVLYPEMGHEAEAEARLLETEVTQPALFVLEYALTRLWQEWGLKIEAMMGHSIGEYVAACVAGVISVEDGVRLVGRRGRLMQGMERGAMLAVRLSEMELEAWLRDSASELSVAAVNGPQQCVLSGSESAIAEAESRLTADGVSVKRLATSHAFHSGMMREAAQVLSGEMEGVTHGNITIPYISNVSGRWAQLEEIRGGEYWGRQMLERVQWWRGVEEVLTSGARVLLEVGPGESLKSVVKEGVRGRDVAVLSTLRGRRRAGGEEAERGMVASLGEMWVRGVDVKWGGMYAGEERRRVELPTYEFERERYWIEARTGAVTGAAARINESESDGAAERKQADVGQWFYVPVWKQSVGRRGPGERAGGRKWLVLWEENGIGEKLVTRLEAAGADVVTVRRGGGYELEGDKRYVIKGDSREEYEQLVEELDLQGWRAERVVHLWSVTDRDGEAEGVAQRVTEFERMQERGFYSLLFLAEALSKAVRQEPLRISVVTRDMQKVTGVERLRPEQTTVLGLCKVIGQEYPHILCWSIDISKPADQIEEEYLIEQLALEVSGEPAENVVAYRAFDRWIQIYEAVPQFDVSDARAGLREGGVYLITGGLGGVGMVLAEHLAQSVKAKLVLTGRQGFPSRTEWQQHLDTHDEHNEVSLKINRLLALEALGAKVMILRADAGDAAQMRDVVQQTLARFDVLNGVVHAAGISGHQAFSTIPDTTQEQVAQHFRAKAHGLLVLEEVLAGLDLDFCLLTSSLSTVLGGLGFAAYAAANSYMDAFVHKHNRGRMAGRWLSVDWDGWQLPEGTAEDEFDPANLSITPREGRKAFARLLPLDGASQVVVSTGNLQARLDKWVRLNLKTRRRDAKAEVHHPTHPRPVTLRTTYVAPRTEIEQSIALIWEDLLGIKPVGIHDDFFELGGHSLLATQVMSRLREELSIDIALRDLFDSATVAELAESVAAAVQAGQELEVPPIKRVSRDEDLPLSFAQQRLWFLDQLEPGSSNYNNPVAVHLQGQLDVEALKRTLSEIVRRHEVLRTTFGSKDGRAVQVISPAAPLNMETIDLSASAAGEREEQVEELVAREYQQSFDLAREWSLRVKLLRLSEEEHIVLLTLHHVVSDAWSVGVLVQEVAALYAAFHQGEPSPLVELPIQYADFAAWQREWLQGEALEKQLNYWREQLLGAPAVLELPTDWPRPAVQTIHGKTLSHTLPTHLSEALKELSRQHDATLFMTLLAALNILLSRYSGQDDIVVGTTIANRNRLETERLIGFFVNTLVVRTDLSGDPTFVELLQRVREVSLGAYAHQDLPFEKLVEELQPERDLSRSPLTQTVFTLQNAPIGALEMPGLNLDFLEAKSVTSKFDIVVDVTHREQSLFVEVQYNTDLFNESTIQRMMEHLDVLLQGIVERPAAQVAELSLLTDAERRHLLLEWNETTAEYPLSSCIHHLFEAQVRRTPDAVAVHSAVGSLSFAELDQRANQLAHFILDCGIGPQSVVALLLDHSCETLIAILGVLKAGCAYLPLDPSHPPVRMAFALADAQAALLITTHSLSERLGAGIAAQLHAGNGSAPPVSAMPPVLALDTDWHRCTALPATAPSLPSLSSSMAAYVIYTSGSTGIPKGVIIEHSSLVNYICWAQSVYLRAGARGDCALYSSLTFDLTVTSVFLPLVTGNTLHLYQAHDGAPALLEVMADNRCQLLKLTPSHLALIRDLDNRDSQIRCLIVGGEALSTELAHAVSESFGHQVEIYNEYGPTEATVGCMIYRFDPKTEERAWVPIGRPAANRQIYILDKRLEPTAEHVTGELYIGGAGVARGYLGRAELTAERFVPDPFSGHVGGRLYRTGDRARRLADGNIEYLGRNDEQVKYHGYRVELNELRLALSAHAKVRDAVVVMRKDGAGGREQLVGYYVGREAVAAEELQRHMQERVIAETVPHWYVHLRRLPLTLNGKVNVAALPAPWAEEDGNGAGGKEGSGEARTEAEAQLVAIWREVLGREQVRIDDNFFELGGDSILSIQIIARANRAGLQLMPRQLFQHPTVAGLAAVAWTAPATVSEQGEVSGEAPLTPIQHWFFEQELAVPAHYNQSLLLQTRRQLSLKTLKAAVRGLLRQHDALRLRFEHGAEGWRQWHAPLSEEMVEQSCTVIELSSVADEELGAAITAAAAAVQRSLDLQHGSLLRVVWIETGVRRSGRLLVVAHHLVVDGVSWRVLLEDLERGYEQAESGEALALGEKTSSYREWAEALVAEAERGLGAEEVRYWTAVADAQVTQIPGAGEGGGEERNARRVEVPLSAERTRELLQEVPAAYNTQINDVLVTALARTLSWWTTKGHGSENGASAAVLVELEGHGREEVSQRVDVSRTVGWFTSIYPVVLESRAAEDVGAALKRVKEQLRAVPRHGLGFGLLRYLGNGEVSARLREMRRAQVAFNYLGQLDQVVGEERWLGIAAESAGAERERSAQRVHAIEVSGYVVGGELRIGWECDGEQYERAEMEAVAGRYRQELEELIVHCVSEKAGGFTPSDFPDAEFNQTELDELMGSRSLWIE